MNNIKSSQFAREPRKLLFLKANPTKNVSKVSVLKVCQPSVHHHEMSYHHPTLPITKWTKPVKGHSIGLVYLFYLFIIFIFVSFDRWVYSFYTWARVTAVCEISLTLSLSLFYLFVNNYYHYLHYPSTINNLLSFLVNDYDDDYIAK